MPLFRSKYQINQYPLDYWIQLIMYVLLDFTFHLSIKFTFYQYYTYLPLDQKIAY